METGTDSSGLHQRRHQRRDSDSDGGSPVWKAQTRQWLVDTPPAAPKTPPLPQNPFPEGLAQVVRLLKRLERSTSSISKGLAWEERYSEIQREWGQLARVVERLLMIVFVVGTALFALLVTVLAVPVPIVSYWSNS